MGGKNTTTFDREPKDFNHSYKDKEEKQKLQFVITEQDNRKERLSEIAKLLKMKIFELEACDEQLVR